jgi:hypothetical protein
MDITDYIPNIFGRSAPSYLPGLLGAEETKNLQNRANVQGLLGAGLALAQGMSNVGPRRSAAENILGALAGGFGAAGGAYEQGVKNYVTQQQIAQTQLAQQDALLKRQQTQAKLDQIKAIEKEDPALARLLMINEAEGAKQLALKQQLSGLTGKTGAETPEALRAQAQNIYATGNAGLKPLADSLIERADRLEVQGRIVPQPVTTQPPAQTTIASTPVIDGQALPGMTVTAAPGPDAQLQQRKNLLLSQNAALAGLTSKDARETIKTNSDEIANIDKQLDRYSASGYNFDAIEKLVPEQFKGRVRSLKDAAQTGALSLADIRKDIADIENKAIEFVTKKTDFTNQDRRVFGGMFQNPDGTPRSIETATPVELMQLENKLYSMRVAEKRAGAPTTNINMPTESERTAGYLTTRLKNSLAQLQTAVGETPSAASPNFRAELVKYVTNSNYLKNLANPEARQRVEAAELDILDAALTLATGAAYTREQLESTRATYFPVLGDKPKTVRDKANRLDQLLRDAAMTKAGRSAPSLDTPAFSNTDLQNAVDAELKRRKDKK